MVGEKYFASQGNFLRLTEEIFALVEACDACNSGKDSTPLLRKDDISTKSGILQTLQRPLIVLACGEVNSGKSSILNALLDENICAVNDLPQHHTIHHFSYGNVEQKLIGTNGVTTCSLPIQKLRYVELIELPGTDATHKTDPALLSQMVALSDVITVLFPVTNPWGAPTWDFLNRLPTEALDKVLFLLPQSDKKSVADLSILIGHVKDLSSKRIGRIPTIFPISAKRARESLTNRALYHQSGLPALKHHLEQLLRSSSSRRNSMKWVRLALSDLLQRIEDRIEDQSRHLILDGRVLAEIEREIDQLRIETLRNQSRNLGGVSKVFQDEAKNAALLIKKRLAFSKRIVRLFTGEDTAYTVEALIQPQLLKSLSEVAGHDFQSHLDSCCQHWSILEERIKKMIGVELQPVEKTRLRLEKSAEKFINRMAKSSTRATSHLRLRGTLDTALRQHHHSMRNILGMILIFTMIAGICGGMYWNWLALLFIGFACAFLLYLVSLIRRDTTEIVQEFGFRLSSQHETFVDSMRGDYEEGIRLFFNDYSHCLDSLRAHLVTKKQDLQPLVKKCNDLFLALKALEQDLNEESA